MRELEEDAAKNSVLTYDRAMVEAAGGLAALEQKIKDTCQCNVEHLASAGAFILHYPSSDHPAAESLMNIEGINGAADDHVVHIDEETSEGDAREIHPLLTVRKPFRITTILHHVCAQHL